jgi:phosphohistidine phosphatase
MEIYILRHGIAEDPAPGTSDRDRNLTAEGRRRLREVLVTARAAGLAPGVLLTSPYRRAVQTAQLAAEVLGFTSELVTTSALVPGADPIALWDEIRAWRDSRQLLLSTHEPLAGITLGWLLGCPQLLVEFKKAAIARVDVDRFGPAPHGVLRWFLTPKLAGVD